MPTFLFTDIEGSTRLWNRAPDAMAAAVAKQESLLRQSIETHGGSIFKTVGDGVYAIFPQPVHAVRAAVEAQHALLAATWPGFAPVDPILIRIAIHTGPADERNGDYFGPTLNRLSRTLAAGHGGQILCTGETVTACAETWPDDIVRRDLGERTLRDVPGSGRIFQIHADGLPERFPPLLTLDPRTHNLPRWASTLIGRETEQARIRELVRSADTHLISLLGTGGVGKTRLATEAVAPLLDEFQDGIRFVDLSALRDDAQVIPAMVAVTGAADQLLDPRDALLEWLRPRTLLLLLDNCEHVVDGVAAICRAILETAPGVTILTTSRVPIRIRGEHRLALEPLPIPETPEATLTNPAVRLFAERATEVNDTFTLDPASAANVTDICRLVDGLPLAIELAAAWVRILSPEALHRRLQESRAMLRDGARDLPDRQRTLTTTIAWSYDLLDPDDQRAFRRLAVFRGGIAVDAASAVLWDGLERDPLWALIRLDTLVQANLLQVSPDPTGEPRFTMLQTILEFAEHTLRSSGEWDAAATAHAGYFSALAQDADEHYRTEDVGVWLDRLDRELENFRGAVDHFAEIGLSKALGLEMAVALWEFLDRRNHLEEARTWLKLLFERSTSADAHLRARAMLLLGNTWFSNHEQAETYYQHARTAAVESGDQQLIQSVEGSLGLVALFRGEFDRAIAIMESLVLEEREAEDVEFLGHALVHLAHTCCQAARFPDALAALDEAEDLLPDPTSVAWLALVRGRVLRRTGGIDEALERLRRAQEAFQRMEAPREEASCLYEIAAALVDRNTVEARRCVLVANDLLSDNVDVFAVEWALEVNALLLAAEGEYESAAILLGATDQWRTSTGTALSPYDREERNALLTRIRQSIGDERLEASLVNGHLESMRSAFELCKQSSGLALSGLS